jgi:phosphoribosylglycinamide formyltransferase 2
MVTLGHTTNLSEFELHLRAVLGLPIHDIRLEHAGCSAVILADKDYDSQPEYNLTDALKEECTRLRIFGKPDAHKGRRLGVTLCYGPIGADLDALRNKAKRLAGTVLGTDPYMEK